ncbi:hypothetical protein LCGC14_0194320 [marine sediment metagenome]|uniref:Uncharacterized protein n=1 Tax=marine sediment metagenome TaxID=412755 RepID=A0A0F9UK19_9ZZZZ|nr:hypothetical protein [bacterium]
MTKHEVFHFVDTFEGASAFLFAVFIRLKGLTAIPAKVRVDEITHKYRVSIHKNERWDQLTEGTKQSIDAKHKLITEKMKELDASRLQNFEENGVRPPLHSNNQDLLMLMAPNISEELIAASTDYNLPELKCEKCAIYFLYEEEIMDTIRNKFQAGYIFNSLSEYYLELEHTELPPTLGVVAKLKKLLKIGRS